MPHIHFVIMPEFSFPDFKVPLLGIASLAAVLQKKGIEVSCSDFRLITPEIPRLFSASSHYDFKTKSAYVSEMPDLPLILHLIRNYEEGKELLYNFENTVLDFEPYLSINHSEIIKGVKAVYLELQKKISGLIKHKLIGFTVVSSNLFFTVLLSLMLRREDKSIKIIYGGSQITLSSNTAELVLRSAVC